MAKELTLPVSETFLSVQGEGRDSLLPTFFIRLAGCNLAERQRGCAYCDTPYAQFRSQAKRFMTVDELVEETVQEMFDHYPGRISVTGGEPLMHAGIAELLEKLTRETKAWISVETNGSLRIPARPREVPYKVLWNVDVKCPSSGMTRFNRLENLETLITGDQVKFVIGDRRDYRYAKTVLSRIRQLYPEVIFQPSFGALEPAKLVQWVLEDRLNVRLSLQAHKIIWSPERRGV